MTTSSLRLAKWLTEYAHLMRVIRSDAGRIWSGMAELFELYFLHTFHTFGDITIAALMSTQQQRQVSVSYFLVTLLTVSEQGTSHQAAFSAVAIVEVISVVVLMKGI